MKHLEAAIKTITLILMGASVIIFSDISKYVIIILCEKLGLIIGAPFDDLIYLIFCIILSHFLRAAALNVWHSRRNKYF